MVTLALKSAFIKILEPDKQDVLESLEFEKEGYFGKSIEIKSTNYLSKVEPIVVKLTPKPLN